MFDDAQVPVANENYCSVCMLQHDDEIHAATVNVRQWFRFEVTKYFVDESEQAYLIDEGDGEFGLVA